ncbi:MAG: J domain-containing protein [Thermoplasmata archaeon]|nr:J domain-containing protein [Thermoplasmata archaeon]
MSMSIKGLRERRALSKVEGLEKKGDVPGLLLMLSDPHEVVVLKTIRALTHRTITGGTDWMIGSGGTGTILHLLESENPHIRRFSLIILSATAKEQGPAVLVNTGGIKGIIGGLSDSDRDVNLYTLDLLNNIANGGSADLLVYSDVLPGLSKVMISADAAVYSSSLNLITTLSSNGLSAELAAKGVVRVLYMKRDNYPNEERGETTTVLERIMSALGYSDLNVFRQNYVQMEEEASHSIPEYNDPAMIQTHQQGYNVYAEHASEDSEDGGMDTFELDERDEEYVLYNEDVRFFPFNILSERLKDMRRLMDEGVITDLEYQNFKAEVLNEVVRSINLECLNCYKALEVPVNASTDEIRMAYRRAAVKYHPDKVSTMGPKVKEVAIEEMTRLNYARDVLMDPERRIKHDIELMGSATQILP